MLKIAICDDDVQELSRISDLLSQYKTEKNATLKYDAFSNAVELLETMKRQAYNILLLNVLMPGMSGLAATHEIRSFDPAVKIIFLTSLPKFAVDSYAVDAHYYLPKHGTPNKLFPILDKVFMKANRVEETLSITLPSGFTRLSLERIEYLEVCGKKLIFQML